MRDILLMIEELDKAGIDIGATVSPDKIEELFENLPISKGQVKALESYGIYYKQNWCWTRKDARNLLKSAKEYYEILGTLPPSPLQRVILHCHKKEIPATSGEASKIIYNLEPESEQLEYVAKFKLKVNADEPLSYGQLQRIIDKRERYIKKLKTKSLRNMETI